jgi:ribosomal protein S18 acetylase RimI-like enzyme
MVDIDRARIEDIAGIKSVLALTWRDTYSSFLPESVIAEVAAAWHSPEVLEAEMNRRLTFTGVARSSSAGVVGVITAHSHGELLVVARLYVVPEFQRQGIGERLMRESCRAFPQSRRVRLHVEEQNPKGRAFYRKLGFWEVEVKTDEIGGIKLESIVMEKHVGDAA